MQITFDLRKQRTPLLPMIPENSLAWLAWEDLKAHKGTFSKATRISRDAREVSPGTLHPHMAYKLSEVFQRLSRRLHPDELQRLNINEAFTRL